MSTNQAIATGGLLTLLDALGLFMPAGLAIAAGIKKKRQAFAIAMVLAAGGL